MPRYEVSVSVCWEPILDTLVIDAPTERAAASIAEDEIREDIKNAPENWQNLHGFDVVCKSKRVGRNEY